MKQALNTPTITTRTCCFGFASAEELSPSLTTGLFAAVDTSAALPTLLLADLGAWHMNSGVSLRTVSRRAVEYAHSRLMDPAEEPLGVFSVIQIDESVKFDHWDPVFHRYAPLIAAGFPPRSAQAFKAALSGPGLALLESLKRHGVTVS